MSRRMGFGGDETGSYKDRDEKGDEGDSLIV